MRRKDTLCSDRQEFLDLAGAAGQRLRHHKQQVCVFYTLGVEQSDRKRVYVGKMCVLKCTNDFLHTHARTHARTHTHTHTHLEQLPQSCSTLKELVVLVK